MQSLVGFIKKTICLTIQSIMPPMCEIFHVPWENQLNWNTLKPWISNQFSWLVQEDTKSFLFIYEQSSLRNRQLKKPNLIGQNSFWIFAYLRKMSPRFLLFFIFLICLSEDVNPFNKNKPPTQRVIRHTPRAHFSAIGQKISFYHSSGSKVCANLFNFSIVDDATVTDKEK